MMQISPLIRSVLTTFFRHDRFYALFSITGSETEYLYYSHILRPLRSLICGRSFSGQLPDLLMKEDLCIECGLGLSVTGGVALDNDDLLAWNSTVGEANAILSALKDRLGEEGRWIIFF